MPPSRVEQLEAIRQRKNTNNRRYRERVKELASDNITVFNRSQSKPFVGVDGEGGNIGDRHYYTVLRAGEDELYTGKPLSSLECLRFISNLSPRNTYVGFFFGYDITKIVEDLPMPVLQALADSKRRTVIDPSGYSRVVPIFWEGYYINYQMGGKKFSVRRDGTDRNITIYDVGAIFQSSFIKAIDAWEIPTPEEREIIVKGKGGRGTWEMATDEIREYNRLECILLARMMDKVRNACRKVGIVPKTWTGAGQLAESLLKTHQLDEYIGKLPSHLIEPTACAYFGGRFEIVYQGMINDVWEYDINSAYPAAMKDLPCLKHGSWEREDNVSYSEDISLCHVTWKPRHEIKDPRTLGPFPFRTPDGSVFEPAKGKGWYWGPEVKVAVASGLWNVEIDEVWTWHPHCQHRPFEWVEDLYNYRKSLPGQEGIVLKLAINSIYGKTAQTIGNPKFYSSVYSGMITSRVRAKILQEAYRIGGCFMFATDAIYIHDKDASPQLGGRLGEWEGNHYDKYFVMLPGLHFNREGGKSKTRGIPISQVNTTKIIETFEKSVFNGVYQITLDTFWGLRICTHLGDKDRLGQWTKETRNYRFIAAADKRYYWTLYEGDKEEKFWVLGIIDRSDNEESAPYMRSMYIQSEQEKIEQLIEADMPDDVEEFVDGEYNGN